MSCWSGSSTGLAATSATSSIRCRNSPTGGHGADIYTTTAGGKLVFGIFAALAELERELIRERTKAGLASARARGRKGGRRFALTKAQVRLAQAAMGNRETRVSELTRELGITRTTLYRYVGPDGELRKTGNASWVWNE
jgi:DNA invertase Pin-like site-specific DNA recombinase